MYNIEKMEKLEKLKKFQTVEYPHGTAHIFYQKDLAFFNITILLLMNEVYTVLKNNL